MLMIPILFNYLQNQPSKSQKSITQFFKDIKDGATSQTSQRDQDNKSKEKPKSNVKRKATSPIYKINEEDKDVKIISENLDCTKSQKRSKIHLLRNENGFGKNEIGNHETTYNVEEVDVKNSAEHRNLDHVESQKGDKVHSPKKENVFGKNETNNHEIKTITPSPNKDLPISRSPLCLVDDNHDDILFSGNKNHETTSPRKVQSPVKTLVKSPFKGNKTPVKCSPGKLISMSQLCFINLPKSKKIFFFFIDFWLLLPIR